MKIISLKALNINSLKGKTEINFLTLTRDSALFAITGPTGSGKSTILDIISCALYGRTSRLANPNDLMSRHSAEAYCEVEFEIKNKRYRSSWSQKRAHKKHDGKFQTAKMELVDLEINKVLPIKSSEVPKKVEELSGLDFGRFTQSMMLAQGGFDAFLKASEKERSELLEKITGTQIYADISIAIFDKHRNLKQDMESDVKILESIELLDGELVKEKEETLAKNIKQKSKTDAELKELTRVLNWVQRLSELTLESKKHEEEFIEASKLKEQNKDSFFKLSLANRALNVSATFSFFTQLKESITADKTNLTKLSKELEVLGVEIKSKTEQHSLINKEFEDASKEFDAQKQKLIFAREFQTKERQTNEQIIKLRVVCKDKQESLKQVSASLSALALKHSEIQKQMESKNSYFKNNHKDEKLLSSLGSIEQSILHYKDEEKSLSESFLKLKLFDAALLEKEAKHKLLKESVDKLSATLKDKELAHKELDKNSSDAKTEETTLKNLLETQTLLKTLSSYKLTLKKIDDEQKELEKNSLEEKSFSLMQEALQQHIDDKKNHIETLRAKKEQEQLLKKYEDDRKKLVDGEACFLCGSTNHPYALDGVHIDKTQAMIDKLSEELKEKELKIKELDSHLFSTRNKIETSSLELEKNEQEIVTLQSIFNQHSFVLVDDSELNLKEREEKLTKELDEIKQTRIKKDELLREINKARELFDAEKASFDGLNLEMQKSISVKEQMQLAIKSSETNLEKHLQSLKSHFKEFGLELNILQIDTQYQALVKRKEIYTQTLQDLKTLEIELKKHELQTKEKQTKETTLSADIKTDEQSLAELELNLKTLTASRVEILNVVDLEAYEKESSAKYEEAQTKMHLFKEILNELITKQKERFTHKQNLDIKTKEDEAKLSQITLKLEKLYEENEFKNEQEFLEAMLSTERREELATLCKNIEDRFILSQSAKVQSAKKLQEHLETPASKSSREELETLQALLEQKANALQESIGSDKKELEVNQENSDKHKSRLASLEIKKEAFKVWIKLNELIGSADGTKFKKFAQGITLEQLVNLANQHLDILSSRYTLSRNEDKLLDLEVIDAFQGNTSRPVSTLSGGESFIVSLALALGLSELASQKIAIDSLFLDEGFGTLDEESLETALNALNLLQSGGKMVGVISHVEALKERIPLQIKVIPNGDGTSYVEI